MSAPPKFTFARACAEYDDEFREHLLGEITDAIGLASVVSADDGRRVMALRTGEQLDALLDADAGTLTMMPAMSDERELRRATLAIAKRLRRNVARARAAGIGDRLGTSRGGNA
jgi:hypothetical protein